VAGSWNEVNKYACLEQEVNAQQSKPIMANRNDDMNFDFNTLFYLLFLYFPDRHSRAGGNLTSFK